MKHYTVDIPVKMTKIKAFLDTAVAGGADVEEVVRSLEELVEIVENLDFASDYNRIGGLPALMALLKSPHASVRAGAAEVIATSAQNHDRVQGEMLAAGVMGVLVSLFGDEDPVVVAKALLAVGSLVRGNDAGVAAFKAAQGPTELWGLLGHQDVRVRRKALQVLQGLLKADHDSRLMAAERGAANQLAQVTIPTKGLRMVPTMRERVSDTPAGSQDQPAGGLR